MTSLKHGPTFALVASLVSGVNAATITNTLNFVPPQAQCNELWTNQNVVLHFTETIASEDGSSGYCSFGIDPGFVWLYPSRLGLDFGLLPRRVTSIQADIYDNCGSDCTKLIAYSAGSQIASVGNTTTHAQTLSLNFDALYPDRCAIRSFEGRVDEIRIITEDPPVVGIQQTNASVVIFWSTNAGPYSLEKTASLAAGSGWATETDNIQIEGTNFLYRTPIAAGSQFFRLRRN